MVSERDKECQRKVNETEVVEISILDNLKPQEKYDGQKVHSYFPITSYRKTETNFLANLIPFLFVVMMTVTQERVNPTQ